MSSSIVGVFNLRRPGIYDFSIEKLNSLPLGELGSWFTMASSISSICLTVKKPSWFWSSWFWSSSTSYISNIELWLSAETSSNRSSLSVSFCSSYARVIGYGGTNSSVWVKSIILASARIFTSSRSFSAGSIFIVKLNVLPWPGPAELTVTVPPADSTICLTMVRPRPRPSLLISAVRWSLPNRVNNFPRSS